MSLKSEVRKIIEQSGPIVLSRLAILALGNDEPKTKERIRVSLKLLRLKDEIYCTDQGYMVTKKKLVRKGLRVEVIPGGEYVATFAKAYQAEQYLELVRLLRDTKNEGTVYENPAMMKDTF